jgi:glutamate--cysteine ligase
MPAPTRSLSVADVHRYVDEDVFLSPLGSPPGGRVGIELEWILAARDAPSPAPAAVASLLPSPLPGGSRLTFEPGGQLELSGPVAPNLGTACRAMRLDTAAVREALRPLAIELVGTGLDTRADAPRVLDAPRYRAMEAYFDSRWPAGRTMMRNTASIQVNLDVGDPATTDARWHLAHDIGPVLTACFANSPFDASGRPSGYRSTRAAVWHAIDPVRTGSARCDPAMSAREAWERYVLDATVMMIRVDDEHSVATREPMSFSRWLTHGHACGWPTVDDLAYHTTTLFPPVRPRGWLELRMIDALPEEWWPVAVAVATALLDDPAASACATESAATTRDRWGSAARDALCDPDLRATAVRCFEAARAALGRLGADADTCAATDEYFERYVARGRCPADEQLEDWMRLQTAGV